MRESLSTLADLLTRSEFHTGLILGLIALIALAVGPRRSTWGQPWALATAAAIMIGVQFVVGQRLGLVAGVALMALGGWIVGDHRWSRRDIAVLGWPVIALGALVIPWRGQVDQSGWFYVATPLVAGCVGLALSKWQDDDNLRLLGILFFVTCFGVWTTVPETDLARLQLGVAIPLAVATLPPISARLTSAGAFALGGAFAWLPTLGGEPRPASIIGAWASIGLILLVPLAHRLWPSAGTLRLYQLLVLHACLVLLAARVIGLWTWAAPAALASVALYGFILFVMHGFVVPRAADWPPPDR